jgi:hypothetical protein
MPHLRVSPVSGPWGEPRDHNPKSLRLGTIMAPPNDYAFHLRGNDCARLRQWPYRRTLPENNLRPIPLTVLASGANAG